MDDARLELPLTYRRRPTRVVLVGTVALGGSEPIRVQSMTTTDTGDTEATALQTLALAEAGCEIVRVTAPNMADASSLGPLRTRLEQLGVKVPLVADIHFNPAAAMVAADFVEKVRVNPGNYADVKKFGIREYTDAEYAAEIDRIRERFAPLVEKCKRLGRAMRIGTNHGSLSDRIMNRYGDSALGMVESALEFVRLCEEQDYRDLVLSMKSSNPFVAIEAYRLLAARMTAEGMDYPFHLGVTEAGDGDDGRTKSAIGIGSLLADGIGDTVRVSLTEDPVREVPVAFALVEPYGRPREPEPGTTTIVSTRLPHGSGRRPTDDVRLGTRTCGSSHPMCAWLDLGTAADGPALAERVRELVAPIGTDVPLADVAHLQLRTIEDLGALESIRPALWHQDGKLPLAVTFDGDLLDMTGALEAATRVAAHVMLRPHSRVAAAWTDSIAQTARFVARGGASFGLCIDATSVSPAHADLRLTESLAQSAVDGAVAAFAATGSPPLIAVVPPPALSPVHAVRLACSLLAGRGAQGSGFLLVDRSALDPLATPSLEGPTRLGGLLADGIGVALRVDGLEPRAALDRMLAVLQATRLRMTRADYISCPSCGRTLFDLEEVTARIKLTTSHLKGVKIAIMGCIVNGPGEMADADFGYVGSSPGKVNLYVGKECVLKNVPAAEADRRLVDLIREHGRWVEPAPAA